MDESIPAAAADNPQAVAAGLETVEMTVGQEPDHSVIWLHGLGADGHDFTPLPPQLGLDTAECSARGVRFVFPHAPVIPVTLNAGMPMRAWYDIRSLTGSRDLDVEGVVRAQASVHGLIERERARGIATRRIFLAGFSQGGAVAMHVALRYPERLAGLITLSSYLLYAGELEAARSVANQDLPVFLAHGRADPVVPFQAGEHTATTLEALDYPLTWHAYTMQHAVCMEEIEDIGRWMRGVMACS